MASSGQRDGMFGRSCRAHRRRPPVPALRPNADRHVEAASTAPSSDLDQALEKLRARFVLLSKNASAGGR